MEERRKFIRLDTSVKIRYKVLMPIDNQNNTNSRDLSTGGVKIEVKEPIKPNTVLWLEIDLPSEADPLQAKGEVVWQEKISNAENSRYEMGIKFLEMDLNDRNKLNKYLFSLLHHKFEQKSN
jgi:c-di-GMP-binding flagellar brake protein YcgR